MKTYLFVYFGATVISSLLVMLLIRLARFIGAVDHPGVRKVHTKPIPRIGGVAIVIATLAMVVPVLLLDNTIGDALRGVLPQIIALLSAGVFIFAVGLIDDIRGIRVRHKLLAQLIGAVALCALGVRIDALSLGGLFNLQFGWFSWPLTIFWIVGITNAINLIDGLDGLAAGIAAITCGVIALFSLNTGQPIMVILMLAMCGALTGFLFFGFNPAKIFLGDCGSMFLGFMLAGGSVLSSTKSMTAVGLALPILAMGVPIFDTLFSIIRRALERRSLFAPDRSHIHHRLLGMGMRQRHVVLILYGVTILAAGLGMFMMITRDVGTLLVFGCVLLLVVLVFRIFGAVRLRSAIRQFQENMALAKQCRQAQEDFEHAQLMLREVRNFDEWWDSMCYAADKLQVGRMLLKPQDDNAEIEPLSWQRDARSGEPHKAIHVSFPYSDSMTGHKSLIEIEVEVDGYLELASHRAKLFGHLIDECSNGYHPVGQNKAASQIS